MPAEPSMASRSRSACPLWRAYSSTRCCHIHRTEVVFSRNGNVSSSFAPSSAASTALGPVALEVLLGTGRVCLFEVRVRGIGAVVEVGYLLTAEDLPDPAALGVAHVPD